MLECFEVFPKLWGGLSFLKTMRWGTRCVEETLRKFFARSDKHPLKYQAVFPAVFRELQGAEAQRGSLLPERVF